MMTSGGGAVAPVGKNFAEWIFETHRDQLDLTALEGGRGYKRFLDSFDFSKLRLSGALRAQNFHIIKFGYPMRRAGYATAMFAAKIGDQSTNTQTAYAYAYWPLGSLDGEGTIDPEYICISPTFESRDGEYRHHFLWYPQFAKGYEENSEDLSAIESDLLDAVSESRLELDVHVFTGEESKVAVVTASVENLRLGIRALAATLAAQGARLRIDILQNHAHPDYVKVFKALESFAQDSLRASEGSRKLNVFEAGGDQGRPQCGQKLIPLTIREALNVCDINFAPWREVWVSHRATDLVVNGVAPMFPIFGNWTYLDGITRELFENRAMHERYARSDRAAGVVQSLRQGRANIQDIAEKDYRAGQLDARIYKAILYAQEYVTLTSLAMCMTSEFVGQTVRSMPAILRRSAFVSPASLRMYADPGMQAKYIFDLCYGVHALHTVVGVIHGDLHLNNMTIFRSENRFVRRGSGPDDTYREVFENAVIAYVAGPRGEADTYVFPHDGWFACPIDFSRAILGPETRARIAAERGDSFAAGFFRTQVSRALRVIHFYAPGFVEKHQETIKGLLLARPEAVFRVMTAVDFLAIGRNYGAFLRELAAHQPEEGDHRNLAVAPEGIELANRIEEVALERLVVGLTELIESQDQNGSAADTARPAANSFAGDVIIPEAFRDYKYSAWSAAPEPVSDKPRTGLPLASKSTLVDCYNINAQMRYSGSDYEKFPPWARLDEIERHLGGLKVSDLASRSERPFLQAQGHLEGYLSLLQERVRKRSGALGESASAAETSSWIAD